MEIFELCQTGSCLFQERSHRAEVRHTAGVKIVMEVRGCETTWRVVAFMMKCCSYSYAWFVNMMVVGLNSTYISTCSRFSINFGGGSDFTLSACR